MATICERAALSVNRMFSFYIMLFAIWVIPDFGFEGKCLVLIAPVPGHCLPIAFAMPYTIAVFEIISHDPNLSEKVDVP